MLENAHLACNFGALRAEAPYGRWGRRLAPGGALRARWYGIPTAEHFFETRLWPMYPSFPFKTDLRNMQKD